MERRKALASKKGLQSKTSLKAKSSLKTKTGLKATKSLQPRSAKMKEIYKSRSGFVKEFLELHPVCQARWDDKCYTKSSDVHEILPRGVGGKIIGGDLSNYMSVCRYCHTMITDNPEEAHRRGLRKWSWEQ